MIGINQVIDFILHLDVHIIGLIGYFGLWTYAILFLIIFLETGVFVAPFFPGESLLFALGTIAATGALNIDILVPLLISAAILGGFVNYAVGLTIGKHLFPPGKKSKFDKYFVRTHQFYDKHGAFAVIISRLLPIIRTFAPFIAGVARMNFLLYSLYNIIGGIAWICLFLYVSYFFGNIPIIKQHFSLVIIAIIIISVLPIIIEIARHLLKSSSVKSKDQQMDRELNGVPAFKREKHEENI